MKKIMFFFPLIYIGGTEVALLSLIKKLKGFDIYIGYVNENSDQGMLEEFSKYAKVVNVEKEKNIEVDYFISCSMKLHLCDAAKNVKRKKTILWVHQVLNLPDSILNTKFRKNLDCVITVSNTICELLKNTFKDIKDKIKYIYNVIDSESLIDKSSEECELELSKELNLVTVSRVCRDKGFSRMLELAKYLRDANIDFKWFIVGDNFNKAEAEEIMESFSEFKENFVWLGFLDNPHKIVKQCDYSVLLSSNETWGLALTEAMCVGVPCISTDFEVVFEQIRDKENGIILSRDDTLSYKDRISEIINDKKKYKDSIIGFKYDNDTILRKWEELLETVLV